MAAINETNIFIQALHIYEEDMLVICQEDIYTKYESEVEMEDPDS